MQRSKLLMWSVRGGQRYIAVDVEGVGRSDYLIKFVFMINRSHFVSNVVKIRTKSIKNKKVSIVTPPNSV